MLSGLDHRQLLGDLGAQSGSHRLSLQATVDFEEPGPVGWLVQADGVPQAARGERSPRMDAQAQGAPAPACAGCGQRAGPLVAPTSESGQLWELVAIPLPCSARSDLCTFQLHGINQ